MLKKQLSTYSFVWHGTAPLKQLALKEIILVLRMFFALEHLMFSLKLPECESAQAFSLLFVTSCVHLSPTQFRGDMPGFQWRQRLHTSAPSLSRCCTKVSCGVAVLLHQHNGIPFIA